MAYKISENNQNNLSDLATLVTKLNLTGHNPATSGNYSHRSSDDGNIAFVSVSGIDKSKFQSEHFTILDIHTCQKIDELDIRKSSDETEVHLAIYRGTNANCVLHSHMLEALLFCDLFKGKAYADLKKLELLKGFKGVTTHETMIQIPIFENTQDITALSKNIETSLKLDPNCYGVLLSGHGIYVWGNSVAEAKRHLEVFEYIFKYYIQKKLIGG